MKKSKVQKKSEISKIILLENIVWVFIALIIIKEEKYKKKKRHEILFFFLFWNKNE